MADSSPPAAPPPSTDAPPPPPLESGRPSDLQPPTSPAANHLTSPPPSSEPPSEPPSQLSPALSSPSQSGPPLSPEVADTHDASAPIASLSSKSEAAGGLSLAAGGGEEAASPAEGLTPSRKPPDKQEEPTTHHAAESREKDAAEANASCEAKEETPRAVSLQQMLGEARARRDGVKRELQAAQTRLTLLTAERKASSKKLERFADREKHTRMPNPELPSVAIRGGGDDELTAEIRQIMKENKELEEVVGAHQETKIYLEKLHNERKDVVRLALPAWREGGRSWVELGVGGEARKLKELREEDKTIKEQLQAKGAELAELQSLVKPSPTRLRNEAEVARLRKEINSHNASRVAAERETATFTKRLLRVRSVLAGFLKSQGLKPQQPIPGDDSELATKLANYVVSLAQRVQALEKQVEQKVEHVAQMESSAQQAASQLRQLVSQRGVAQRKHCANSEEQATNVQSPTAVVASPD
ncbi:MAG: hypothetical protein SGPRY_008628 [Prymnesium sp.]